MDHFLFNCLLVTLVHLYICFQLDNVSAGVTEWKGLLKDYWTRFNSYCTRAQRVHIHQVWLGSCCYPWVCCFCWKFLVLFSLSLSFNFLFNLLIINIIKCLQVEEMLGKTFGDFLFASIPNKDRACPRYEIFTNYMFYVLIPVAC